MPQTLGFCNRETNPHMLGPFCSLLCSYQICLQVGIRHVKDMYTHQKTVNILVILKQFIIHLYSNKLKK